MEVVNCGTGNKIPYAVQDSIISFNGGELMLDLARYERDVARTLDICRDKFGGLVMRRRLKFRLESMSMWRLRTSAFRHRRLQLKMRNSRRK